MLKPDGVLLISCPNKLEYTRQARLPQRVPREGALPRRSWRNWSARAFPTIAWYGQRPSFFSVIAPEGAAGAPARSSRSTRTSPAEAAAMRSPTRSTSSSSRAARARRSPPCPRALSVLADRDDWVHRDYEKVMRTMRRRAHDDSSPRAASAPSSPSASGDRTPRGAAAARASQRDALEKDAELARELDGARARPSAARHSGHRARATLEPSTLKHATRSIRARADWRWWLAPAAVSALRPRGQSPHAPYNSR